MRYPLTLIKVDGDREERIAFYAKHYEVSVKEPGRVAREVIRYDYAGTTRSSLMAHYAQLGFISMEEL